MFFKYNTHRHWLYISLLILWGALYCIKFTCLGYGTLHSFPPKMLFFLKSKCGRINALYHTHGQKKEEKKTKKTCCNTFK